MNKIKEKETVGGTAIQLGIHRLIAGSIALTPAFLDNR